MAGGYWSLIDELSSISSLKCHNVCLFFGKLFTRYVLLGYVVIGDYCISLIRSLKNIKMLLYFLDI